MIRWEKEMPYEAAVAGEPPESFVEIDGQSVHCEDSGAGPAIVMLHGFASSAFSFRLLREPLSRSFRILAFDLNGFGLTQRPQARAAYHHEAQAELIVRVLRQKGIEQFHLMGHSYGAVISNHIAERYSDRVLKVMLVCPPAEFAGESPWYLRGKLGVQLAMLMLRLLLSNPERFYQLSKKAVFRDESLSREVSDHYRRSMLVEGFKRACLGYVETFGNHRDSMIRYQSIRQPVLIIAGEQDEVVPREKIDTVVGMIAHVETVTIPECGHCPPEEQPEAVIEATLRFLAS